MSEGLYSNLEEDQGLRSIKPVEMRGATAHLHRFYVDVIHPMPEEQRKFLFNEVKILVERLPRVSTNALLPFIVGDSSRFIVSTAVIDYLSLASLTDDDPMSRVKDVIGILARGIPKNEGAVFGALLFLGDERVCRLLLPLRDTLDTDAIREVTNSVTGFIYSASTDFYLDWLEGLEGDRRDSQFGLVASGLALIPKRATVKDVVFTGQRPFPFTGVSAEQAAALRKEVPIQEYRRRIEKRMQDLERSEPPPRVMPHVLAEWGLKPVTSPGETFDLGDRSKTPGQMRDQGSQPLIPEGRVAHIEEEWWQGDGGILLIWGILNPDGPTLYAIGIDETAAGARTYVRCLHMLGGQTTYAPHRRPDPTFRSLADDVRDIADWLAESGRQDVVASIPHFVVPANGSQELGALAHHVLLQGRGIRSQDWGRFVAYQRQFKTDFFGAAATEMREFYNRRRSELIAAGKPLDDLKMFEMRYRHMPAFQNAAIPTYPSSEYTEDLAAEWWSHVSQPDSMFAALGALQVMWEGAYGLIGPLAKVGWSTVVEFLSVRFPLPPEDARKVR